jgi:aminoglycoside phosphotransferase
MRLAPDAAVPQRDALLDADLVARLFPGVTTCERVYAKYRVGESLRVVYRLDGAHHVAGRTFAEGKSEAAYERARADAVPAGPLPPVLHARELDAVFWGFPNDRKLAKLPLLDPGSAELARLLGRPCAAVRVVAYAAEQSATAQCLDASGRALAYVKVHAGDGAGRERQQLEAAAPLVPRVIGASAADGALAVEPVEGRRLDSLRGADLADALHRLGVALATLHTACPLPDRPFTRLAPERLATVVEIVTRARPDAGDIAARVLAGLLDGIEEAEGPAVCVHGDANLRNAIATGTGIALLDLEHAAAGPAAADLGQLLAHLTAARVLGRITRADERRLSRALLDGYATVARPPGSLHWHTSASLLVRVVHSAINRVRPDALGRLVPLLEAAAE